MAKRSETVAVPSPRPEEAESGFRSSLFYWTGLLEARYNQDFIKAMRPRRVTVPRFRALSVLMGLSDLTVNELARESLIERSALSRLLDQLEAEGLIERRRKSGDKRALAIRITAAGRADYLSMRPARRGVLRRAVEGIPPEDIQRVMATVQRMLANLEGAPAPRAVRRKA